MSDFSWHSWRGHLGPRWFAAVCLPPVQILTFLCPEPQRCRTPHATTSSRWLPALRRLGGSEACVWELMYIARISAQMPSAALWGARLLPAGGGGRCRLLTSTAECEGHSRHVRAMPSGSSASPVPVIEHTHGECATLRSASRALLAEVRHSQTCKHATRRSPTRPTRCGAWRSVRPGPGCAGMRRSYNRYILQHICSPPASSSSPRPPPTSYAAPRTPDQQAKRTN